MTLRDPGQPDVQPPRYVMPFRFYQALRSASNCSQLPVRDGGMSLLSLYPLLWRHVLNAKSRRWRQSLPQEHKRRLFPARRSKAVGESWAQH